jgi:sugar phosphate isomerase/epimerase
VSLRSAITVCAVPQAVSGPFVFHGASPNEFFANLQKAKEIGFDAVELFLPDAKRIQAASVKAQLDTLSLDLAAVGSGAGWVVHQLSLTAPVNSERVKAIDFVKSLIDWAGPWAAPIIIGSMQGRVAVGEDRSEVLKRLGDSLSQLSEYAATRYQSHLFYEPLNRYETNLFTRIGDARDWLESQEFSNVLILADLFHMNIEEVDLAGAIRNCSRSGKNWIGHVHWADSNRQAMGFGHTSTDSIVAALKSIDYQGYLSGEVFPMPDSESAARQTLLSIQLSIQLATNQLLT